MCTPSLFERCSPCMHLQGSLHRGVHRLTGLVRLQVLRRSAISDSGVQQPSGLLRRRLGRLHSLRLLSGRGGRTDAAASAANSKGALGSRAASLLTQRHVIVDLQGVCLRGWPGAVSEPGRAAVPALRPRAAFGVRTAAAGASAARHSKFTAQRQAIGSRRMHAAHPMNSSKVHDMQTGGFAVRAISGALQHSDSVASSATASARQLPVALITTSGCQFCKQVHFGCFFTLLAGAAVSAWSVSQNWR